MINPNITETGELLAARLSACFVLQKEIPHHKN
jgi:hypothetical protein